MEFLLKILHSSWELLLEASPYILFGIIISGFLKVFLSPETISRHLGKGRFKSVFKAAIIGIPLPLCSCGVLPAAATLKKQGANNGATTAFLISTPESGVDSISITYALLDPIMTVMRPVAAFVSALIAGLLENSFSSGEEIKLAQSCGCSKSSCCSSKGKTIENEQLSIKQKMIHGLKFAFGEIWGELAGWFFTGLLIAGTISAIIPQEFLEKYLSGGFGSMLIMLGIGIPLYICATASTPIAAALILKGVSPGAALVFLLTGPATNITSLSVILGVLGKRGTGIYLGTVAVVALGFGILTEYIYEIAAINITAEIAKHSKVLPYEFKLIAAIIILTISIKPLLAKKK
jgi:uncharacterized protein